MLITSRAILSIIVFLSLVHAIISQSDRNNGTTRLLIIGDSVHRYMVEDWCSFYGGTLYNDGMNLSTNASFPFTMKGIFKKHPRRVRGWEPRVCESARSNAVVGFLFHKFGVKPHPPWHTPIATTAGLNKTMLGKKMSLEAFFEWTQKPGIESLKIAIGGAPHGVLLNSIFWDIAPRILEPAPLAHAEFLSQWSVNVSSLMQIVKQHTSQSIWHGWHTSAPFRVGSGEHHPHWNTMEHRKLLTDMNTRSLEIAKANGYDAIDFNEIIGKDRGTLRMRDTLHPSAELLIKLLDEVLQRTVTAKSKKPLQ
jgi:hypothetical protein